MCDFVLLKVSNPRTSVPVCFLLHEHHRHQSVMSDSETFLTSRYSMRKRFFPACTGFLLSFETPCSSTQLHEHNCEFNRLPDPITGPVDGALK